MKGAYEKNRFLLKTVRIFCYDFKVLQKNSDVKIFGRNLCPKLKPPKFLEVNVALQA